MAPLGDPGRAGILRGSVVIFLVTGHQTPFDRLVRIVDEWAQIDGRADIFGQIGRGAYRPTQFPWVRFLSPRDFRERVQEASAVVAHAGTGTIIEVLQCPKPLLVMPRLTKLKETRNDHQVATARHFEQAGYLLTAADRDELICRLRELESFRPSKKIGDRASQQILDRLQRFIFLAESSPVSYRAGSHLEA